MNSNIDINSILTEISKGFSSRCNSSLSNDTGYSEGPESPIPPAQDPTEREFVFNIGVVNAPQPGVRTLKREMEDGSVEVTVAQTPSGKVREFSVEELEKQRTIREEMKEKFEKSLS